MHPEHVKLCEQYHVPMDAANDVPSYLILVERLNAEVGSLRIALSAERLENHTLRDALERQQII